MDELTDKLKIGKDKFIWTTCLTQKSTQLDGKKSKPAQNETYLLEMKRYLFKYQISLPTCFYYCSTELQFLTVAGMLSRDTLPSARSEFWGVASRVPSLQATLPPSPKHFR